MKKALVALIVLLACSAPAAAGTPPDVVVRSVTDQVLGILRSAEEDRQANPRDVIQRVEAAVQPHFNFGRMTQFALARHWREATREQQTALTAQFRTLLLRVYALGIALYGNHPIDYRPLRIAAAETDVVVHSVIIRPGEPVAIDYSMENIAGIWRAYDVRIDGVSLVLNYRDTFDREIRKNGIDGLIRTLSTKNEALAARSSTD